MPRRGRRLAVGGVVALLLASRAAAQTAPALGTAASFAVLGGSSVDNSGATRVSANVGVTPGTTLRGFPPGTIVLGDLFVDNSTAREAHRDAAAAYDVLAAQQGISLPPPNPDGVVELGTGVYRITAPLPTPLKLTGGSTAVWIFQAPSSLVTAEGSSVLLRGGANYNNVFWQVDGTATLGAHSAFAGTIIARGDVRLQRDVSMNGRALSLNGAVTLNTDDVSCCDPIEFAPLSLPAAKVGVAYNPSIALSGGMAPYQVSLFDGTLPPGLTPASVSGTPTAEGTYAFTLLAVDARGCSSIHTYTITVCGTIVVSFDPKPNAKACQPFQRQIVVTGCSPPYKIVVKGLPDGLMNTGDVIFGTPTMPGCFPITIDVTDANGFTASLPVTLCVDCGLTLPDLSPSTATACVLYTANLTPSCGKPPYVFTATGVPPWLVGPSPVISGTPTAPGHFTFTVNVVDANGCADTRTYTLDVGAAPPPPPRPKIPLNATVCTPYDSGPLPGVLVDPATLPPGLVFVNSSLQGTPMQCGTFCFTRKLANVPPCTSDTQEYCITIALPPLTLKQPLAPLQAGVATNQTLTPSFCIPFTCSVTGPLPAGVLLPDCTLQGVPQPGNYDFCVTAVADGCRAVTQCYQGIIPPVAACGGSLTFVSPPRELPEGTVGVSYPQQIFSATGGTPPYKYVIAAQPSPPPGVILLTSGVLSGIPMASGRFNFAVRATDAAGACTEAVWTIVVGPVPPLVADVPALSPWALLLMALGIVAVAVGVNRRAS